MGAPGGLDRLADPDGLAGRVEDRALLDLLAGARRLAGAGDRADRDARRAGEALHPLPGGGARDDDGVVAHVDQRQGIHLQIVDGERGHLRFGERAAHAVAVDHRTVQQRGGHEGLDGVAAADLERHDGAERPAEILLHHGDGARDRVRVGEALLTDQRRAHVGDDGDVVVVGQIHRVHERDDGALAIEPPHVQERQVRAAAATGAENPGADRERFDLVGGDGTEGGHRLRMLSCRP